MPTAPVSFSADDGSADPRVAAALTAYDGGSGGSGDVLLALASSRLLVPVVARLDEADESGAEKSSHMAAVSTISRSGRRGLLAFTSLDTLKAWDPAARPVPVTTRSAAEAALADRADAIVIDLAGPVTFPVEAEDLRSLAAGWRSHTVDLGVPAQATSPATAQAARSGQGGQNGPSGSGRVSAALRRLRRRGQR